MSGNKFKKIEREKTKCNYIYKKQAHVFFVIKDLKYIGKKKRSSEFKIQIVGNKNQISGNDSSSK